MLFFSTFNKSYNSEEQELLRLISASEHIISKTPNVRLIVRHRPSGNMYTMIHPSGSKGKGRTGKEKYIHKDNTLLPAYIKRYCAEKVNRLSTRSLKILRNDPSAYDSKAVPVLLESLSREFGVLVPQELSSNSVQLEAWRTANTPDDTFRKDSLTIQTLRGDLVRSKNECLTSNLLYSLGITYVYEPKLRLKNGDIIRPDFMMKSHVNGKVYYLEICGMMSDPQYAENVYKKVSIYSKNNIILGHNLLLLFESDTIPFDISVLEKMIRTTVLREL